MHANRDRGVTARAVPAGSIALSNGKAIVAPAPRNTARRDKGRRARYRLTQSPR